MYLASHSIMYALRRRVLDSLKRAGARVQEFGRDVLEQMIDRVIPQKHQDRYSPRELFARGLIKWLIVGGGGAAAGLLGGIPGAVAGTGAADIVVRAADP